MNFLKTMSSESENFVTREEFRQFTERSDQQFQQSQQQFQMMMEILQNLQTSRAGDGAGQKFQESNVASREELGASERPMHVSGVEILDGGASKEIFLDPSLLLEEQGERAPPKVSTRKSSRKKSVSPEDELRRLREREAQEIANRPEFVGGTVLRTIVSEEFKETMFSLNWKSYITIRKLIDIFYRKHKFAKGITVTLQASVTQEIRSQILNDCRNMHHSKANADKDFEFPYNITEDFQLDLLSFDQFDVLLRWKMRPVDKAQFASILRATVSMKFPEGFKIGALNVNTQFQVYQRFTEDFRRMITWMSFSNDEIGGFYDRAKDPDRGFVPEVDSSKEKGIVQIFRDMMPKQLSEYLFAKMKKPPGGGKYWSDPMAFIDAVDVVAYAMNSEFDTYVRPLLNRYSEGAISHDGSKHLKLLSEALLSDEPILDGDPVVLLNEGEKAMFFAAMEAQHKSKSKVDHLPCIKTIFSGVKQCPDGATCRFSHDEALLREKKKSMDKALQKSYYSSLEETEVEQDVFPDEI